MDEDIGRGRRAFLAGSALVPAGALAAAAAAQVSAGSRSAGPIAAGRDCTLTGKTAFVSGAARGIGWAIAVELAANNADVMIFDIAGYVSSASNAKPATPVDLAETKRQIEAHGRTCIADAAFSVVLVPKDGNVAVRFSKPVAAAGRQDMIDARPIRRRRVSAGGRISHARPFCHLFCRARLGPPTRSEDFSFLPLRPWRWLSGP